jgi:3-phosphoshikimate 1-carboxyvinyltransferase
MTAATLAARGITVESLGTGQWRIAPGPISGATVDIEPDLSNAAPFLAAALVTGGRVTITGWPETTTQVGADLIDLLPLFGASVQRTADRLTVTGGGTLTGVDLDLSTGGELAPTIAAIAALASSPSTITGIGHIRHHETDRLAALSTELNALGAQVTELDDGLRIEPRGLTGGLWHSYHDHRMATAGAIIGLRVPGVQIDDVATTAKTLPQFTQLWQRMLAGSASV